MKTGYRSFDCAYEVCEFLDTLEEEQVISVTNTSRKYYVFYKKK